MSILDERDFNMGFKTIKNKWTVSGCFQAIIFLLAVSIFFLGFAIWFSMGGEDCPECPECPERIEEYGET
ncbi:MAG: hypothetical protein OXC03_01495 [Flavobacteriaceae bacterium]|nr:hypothetical protein [Flavobacteriaceae bacterium]